MLNLIRILSKNLATILVVFLIASPTYAINSNNINIGDKAPYFELDGYSKNNPDKDLWKLSDFKGVWTVLYFYPKDFTSGCTIEARSFEKLSPEFEKLNAMIVGISNDIQESHESFCSKESLSFTLLTDLQGIVSEKYSSWNKPYSKRNTFLIDPEGVIRYSWMNVNPLKHPTDVLKKLTELQV
ncbi:peroxiredoxin [Prochlorococcus marinus]|uniref:thioredoxin-dependent peroxiredoxin n=1 Tax=Prochlorococcus marinus (strain MIT 9211) TaxID=93059 RepID=A9BAC6_PROM4|nr:peroxiredoxin [Prochlorococcus marinus]ABX08788.1 Alkyl hydroperoxide reductase/ Thiol specific antioxidant/ Mal allergens family protein [Prochlorococcus marinus str. MIT 9211]